MKTDITLTVNGEAVRESVEPRTNLADLLRDHLRLTGTHLGCEMGSCGACLVMLNGAPVHACLVLAVQTSGQTIKTIEGLNESGEIADLQENFHDRNALQCGFCTNGMVMSAQALLSENLTPTRSEIRDALSGNYCRCTGYEGIVDAIATTAQQRVVKAEGTQ